VSDDHDDALERLLRLVPYFLDRVSLAGALAPIDVTAGTEITREGTEAHELYSNSTTSDGWLAHQSVSVTSDGFFAIKGGLSAPDSARLHAVLIISSR
jgi:hypothetical protein